MSSPDKEKSVDAASPSTPRAQVKKTLHPVAAQTMSMQLDQASSSNGNSEDGSLTFPSLHSLQQSTEADSRKEVWKKRKQM